VSKYNSRKTSYNGELFDSKKEARRYAELVLMERAGVITDLRRQVKFELIPAQYEEYERISPKTGKRLKAGKKCVEQSVVYNADFVYMKDGKQVVEDAKGMRTEKYIIKRKLMLWIHGIKIVEV
jgi:hypothetical protein